MTTIQPRGKRVVLDLTRPVRHGEVSALAAKAGVSRQSLGAILRGDRWPGSATMTKLAAVLHTDREGVVEWLLIQWADR